MERNTIQPDRITKPFQLLAAWLVGLIVVNASFLGAASLISLQSWGPNALIIASIANVPLFIGSIFLLQTKFRAEMQTDDYYSAYKKEERQIELNKVQLRIETELKEKYKIENSIIEAVKIEDSQVRVAEVEKLITEKEDLSLISKYSSSKLLYYLYSGIYSLDKYGIVTLTLRSNKLEIPFKNTLKEIYPLIVDGLVEGNLEDLSSFKLTKIGKRITDKIENDQLWNFSNEKEKYQSFSAENLKELLLKNDN